MRCLVPQERFHLKSDRKLRPFIHPALRQEERSTWVLPFPLGSAHLQQGGSKGEVMLPRKEVIQPQLPLRLPCYDFVPITRPTLGAMRLQVLPAFMT